MSQQTNCARSFDIAFLGNYSKDTVVSAAGRRLAEGGAFNCAAHVAARMGLRLAALRTSLVER